MERSKFETRLDADQTLEVAGPIRDLTRSASWPVYVELLKGARIQAREIAFDEAADQMGYWKGFVDGLKAAENLPQEVLMVADGVLERRDMVDAKEQREGRLEEVESDPTF